MEQLNLFDLPPLPPPSPVPPSPPLVYAHCQLSDRAAIVHQRTVLKIYTQLQTRLVELQRDTPRPHRKAEITRLQACRNRAIAQIKALNGDMYW